VPKSRPLEIAQGSCERPTRENCSVGELRPVLCPGWLPHVLFDSVDSSDLSGVERALTSIRQELDRRVAVAGARQDTPDLVVVVRELAELQPEACNQLGAVATAGPSVNIRAIAASERPVHDLMQVCPSSGTSERGWFCRPPMRRRALR
jgi:hypothetical protein